MNAPGGFPGLLNECVEWANVDGKWVPTGERAPMQLRLQVRREQARQS